MALRIQSILILELIHEVGFETKEREEGREYGEMELEEV